jgi:Mn-dependent DtxR family transcriptional regulator
VANKVEVFSKIKEIHHRLQVANPQVLVSVIMRELSITPEEASRHLTGLQAMDLIKFKGKAAAAVELTRSGATTTMKMANPRPEEPAKQPERV